jgi:hypothetical protein
MILSFGRKETQIYFQTFVDDFDLTISLGMIRNVEMQLGVMKPKQFLPKIASESWIIV